MKRVKKKKKEAERKGDTTLFTLIGLITRNLGNLIKDVDILGIAFHINFYFSLDGSPYEVKHLTYILSGVYEFIWAVGQVLVWSTEGE